MLEYDFLDLLLEEIEERKATETSEQESSSEIDNSYEEYEPCTYEQYMIDLFE